MLMNFRNKPDNRVSKRYMAAVGALYGDTQPKPHPKPNALPRSPNCPTEDQEQFALVKWLRLKGIPHYHIPNQRQANVAYGVKLKALGVSKGIPDIVIPKARKGHHGLYIELKRTKGGIVSPEQKDWIRILTAEGYLAKIAYGAEDAIKIITEYLA
jgi:hypothetical protein